MPAKGRIFFLFNTPAQIATMQAAYLAAIRANPATANIPIIMLGIQPRNTGGTAYPGGLTTEAAEQAQVASLNDPRIFFCPVIGDPAGSWETGTGSVNAQNGTGNEDWMYDTVAAHPNAWGDRNIFAAGTVKCVRNWLSALGY